MAASIRLTRQTAAPQDNEVRVLPHVLLGVGFQHPGQPQPKRPEPPADNRATPPLTPVDVGKTTQQLRPNARTIIGGGGSMPGPNPHRLAASSLHARDDV